MYERMFENYTGEVMTKDEVCEALKISKSTVDRLIKTNEIQYIKIGKRVLITKEDLRNYLIKNIKM